MMTVSHDDVMARLLLDRRERIKARVRELLAEASAQVESRLEEQDNTVKGRHTPSHRQVIVNLR